MKKTIIILFCLFVVSGLFANPIDTLIAKQVAVNWFVERNVDYKGDEIKINEIITINEKSENLFFILNFANNSGYIIVSADDDVIPVLGYSFEHNYTNENHPPAYDYWLGTYKKQILYVKENKLKADQFVTDEWNRLNISAKSFSPQKDTKDVSPLLDTEWNQGSGWNVYCPTDANGPGGHVWAGCVATSMSQIMKYWNYPTIGDGSHSYTHGTYGTLSANFGATEYDWWNMNDYTSTNATALLMYHCAVSVDMDFSPSGSSAYHDDARNAFVNYFGYSASYFYNNGNDLSETTIRDNLNVGRPLIYAGSGANGGHSFIIDGYQGTNYFHINWGWGGAYQTEYFYLSDLTPGSHNYNNNNDAVYNIVPNISCDLVLSSSSIVGNYEDFCSITLSPGFSTGGDFRARIIPGDAKNGIKISFSTPCHGLTKLIIYDENDNEITTLINQYLFKDSYDFFWDKTDDKGNAVENGNYYYKLITINDIVTKQLIIE